MHKIINSYLAKFSEEHGYLSEDESVQFEYFVNYVIAYEKFPRELDLSYITSDSQECGIDGIIFLIDDELASTIDEVEAIFLRPKKNISVEIIFTQAKSSENYDRGEILKFTDAVEDFISTRYQLPQGSFLQSCRTIYDYIVSNVSRVKNGRPICKMYYACTSSNPIASEIEATRKSAEEKIKGTGFVRHVDFEYLGLSELIDLWNKTVNSTTATIEVKDYIAFPSMGGITEAYVAIVSGKEFIEKLLINDDGKIRTNIFEENVRFFLGEDNPVNKAIKRTLEDPKQSDKFAIFNNGITIISPDVKVQNKRISLENYQIVNGCQTSNVLFDCREADIKNAYITVKIIEATDIDVISDIVSATNSQSKVDENQFLAFNPFVRRLEKYFAEAKPLSKGQELYFERRFEQYRNTEIPKKRIFSILETGRALGALFLEKPDLASRYPNKFISEMKDTLFDERNAEEAYYISALVDYSLRPYYQRNKSLYNYAKYKWHIITIFGYLCANRVPPRLMYKKKVDEYCKIIFKLCASENKMQELINKIPRILTEIGLKRDRDEVRSAAYAKDVIKYCRENFIKTGENK